MSTRSKYNIIFIKSFSNGGLNKLEETLINFFSRSRKWKVKVFIVDYRLFGVNIPETKLAHGIIVLNKKWFFCSKILGKGITLLLYLLFNLYIKSSNPFRSIIVEENPDVIIWTHDSLSYIPFIPHLKNTKQFFLFQEWLREKNEYLYKRQALSKQKLWSIIRSIILNKSVNFLKNVNGIFYHSPLVLQMINKTLKGSFKMNLYEVPIGVDINYYTLRNKNGNKKNEQDKDIKNILYIGPLSDFKGVSLASEALIKIKQRYNIKLRFINIYYKKGRDYFMIERQLKINGIPLIFKRSVSDDDKINIIRNADLLLHVPKIEPYGLTILEALSCGLKVVTYKGVGVASYLSNQKGLYIFQHYSSDQLMKTILVALKQRVLPEEIRESFLEHHLTDEVFFKKVEKYIMSHLL